jgi:DNA invertase Pin-like site-specific DNA recombinase
MIIGYARTSTVDQLAGFDAQLRDLKEAGCEEVFSEQLSSVAKRPKLIEAIKYVRKGDSLVITKLDRLARSVKDLNDIASELDAKGVSLKILALNIDTGTPTGKLMFNMLGSIAEFERDLMLERQREGIAKAKDEGKYKGRQPTALAKTNDVRELIEKGLKAPQIASQVGIGVASVYRIKKNLGI